MENHQNLGVTQKDANATIQGKGAQKLDQCEKRRLIVYLGAQRHEQMYHKMSPKKRFLQHITLVFINRLFVLISL